MTWPIPARILTEDELRIIEQKLERGEPLDTGEAWTLVRAVRSLLNPLRRLA